MLLCFLFLVESSRAQESKSQNSDSKIMAEIVVALHGRRASLQYLTKTAAAARICTGLFYRLQGAYYATAAAPASSKWEEEEVVQSSSCSSSKKGGKWMKLPPFNSTIDNAAASVAKEFSRVHRLKRGEISSTTTPTTTTTTTTTNMTALKWVLRCCPQLPRCLVQKLFRLRQVRRESVNSTSTTNLGTQAQECRFRRVSAKDAMNSGDMILLPVTVQESRSEKPESRCSDWPSEKQQGKCNDDELTYMHSLVLYKDPSIIVVNKPPGIPVQGGIGIKKSLDALASTYLRYDYSEPPRLVHRLDRDSSGVLVMGRTQTSATILHSIFREKTFGASTDTNNTKRILQRKYWALVIGTPRRASGLISAPLGKVVVDNGKSERITVVNDTKNMSSQHAVTEYRMIQSPIQGLTWIELCPLTGRKHQLRVHCAEVLGTPIVGDYKYGWQAHRKWKPFPWSKHGSSLTEKVPMWKVLPFILDLESGSISEKQPHLHLHCRQMILPDVHLALQQVHSDSDLDLSELESLDFVAPLPSHMQRSWDILNS